MNIEQVDSGGQIVVVGFDRTGGKFPSVLSLRLEVRHEWTYCLLCALCLPFTSGDTGWVGGTQKVEVDRWRTKLFLFL